MRVCVAPSTGPECSIWTFDEGGEVATDIPPLQLYHQESSSAAKLIYMPVPRILSLCDGTHQLHESDSLSGY